MRASPKILLPPVRTPEGFLGTLSTSLLPGLGRREAIDEFERGFSLWLGIDSVAVASARGGLLSVLRSLERVGGKDEVILAAYNFHAMPTMVRAAGFNLRYVDIEPRTYALDTRQLEQTLSERTAAILVTHMYGLPADMDAIIRLAGRAGVPVIEDCAHAMGATYKGKPVGTFGDAAVFSLGMSKPLPCAGGGMVVARNAGLLHSVREITPRLGHTSPLNSLAAAAKAAMMALGTHPSLYPPFTRRILQLGRRVGIDIGNVLFEERERPGDAQPSTSAISPLQATLGLRQLPVLDTMNKKRVKNAEQLSRLLGKGIAPHLPAGRTHVYTHYAIRVKEPGAFRKALWKHGVQTRGSYIRNCAPSGFRNTDQAVASVVYLPVHSRMSGEEIELLAEAVLDGMDDISP